MVKEYGIEILVLNEPEKLFEFRDLLAERYSSLQIISEEKLSNCNYIVFKCRSRQIMAIHRLQANPSPAGHLYKIYEIKPDESRKYLVNRSIFDIEQINPYNEFNYDVDGIVHVRYSRQRAPFIETPPSSPSSSEEIVLNR